jgi:hypothetical protein
MRSGLIDQPYSSLCMAHYLRVEPSLYFPPLHLVVGGDDLPWLLEVPSSQLQVLQIPCTWDPFPPDQLVFDQLPWLDLLSSCRCMQCAMHVISEPVALVLDSRLKTSTYMSPMQILVPLAWTSRGPIEAWAPSKVAEPPNTPLALEQTIVFSISWPSVMESPP